MTELKLVDSLVYRLTSCKLADQVEAPGRMSNIFFLADVGAKFRYSFGYDGRLDFSRFLNFSGVVWYYGQNLRKMGVLFADGPRLEFKTVHGCREDVLSSGHSGRK